MILSGVGENGWRLLLLLKLMKRFDLVVLLRVFIICIYDFYVNFLIFFIVRNLIKKVYKYLINFFFIWRV